jgi:hypothetical protein
MRPSWLQSSVIAVNMASPAERMRERLGLFEIQGSRTHSGPE